MWRRPHCTFALLLPLPTAGNPTAEVTGAGIGADVVQRAQEYCNGPYRGCTSIKRYRRRDKLI